MDRTAALPVVALVATVALLVQMLLAPPLAMRMLSGPAAWPTALCTATPSDRSVDPVHHQSPPAFPHDHDDCPLCRSSSVALGLPVAVYLAPVVVANWRNCGGGTSSTVQAIHLQGSAPHGLT
jgi:hypothetical protein